VPFSSPLPVPALRHLSVQGRGISGVCEKEEWCEWSTHRVRSSSAPAHRTPSGGTLAGPAHRSPRPSPSPGSSPGSPPGPGLATGLPRVPDMVQDLLTQLPVLHVPASAPVLQPDTGATAPPVVHILISAAGNVPVLQVPVHPLRSNLAYVPLVQVPAAPHPKLHVAGAEAQLPVEQVRYPVPVSKEKPMIRGCSYRICRIGTG